MSSSGKLIKADNSEINCAPLWLREEKVASIEKFAPRVEVIAEPVEPTPPPDPEALAQQILEEAHLQAEQIKREAYQAGLAQGRATAEAAVHQEFEQLRQQYADSLAKLMSLRQQLIELHEKEIVRLVISIAKKIVHREVKVDREIVISLIKSALARIGDQSAATIRLHMDDYNYVQSRRGEFLSGENGIVKLVDDRSITRGGCLIETDFGQIDARIEQQFKQIEKALLEEEE